MYFCRLIMLAGLQNITFEFGARLIVKNATWHIHPSERIGLVGFNGTGKSTLLRLLVGEYQPSAGSVERSRGISIGYLHQDLLSFDSGESILAVALGAFSDILRLEEELAELERKHAATVSGNSPDVEQIGEAYAHKLHELETLGGYTIHHKTAEILQGLGFANSDLQRPYREFSGGWRMRVLLARMILQQPDLLLLDEPTNHLDLPSIEWLEKYLQNYQGAVVIVSHDKYFLNRMVTKIVELYQQQLHFYSGNYDFYEQEKAVRIEMQQRAYENQQDYIRQNERLVERFRAKASKAAMAQSLIRKLEKLERVEEPNLERPTIRINFPVEKVPGKVIVELKDVSKAFGEIQILDHASAEIARHDKIALIGANGKGKSTLLRILAGTETFEGLRKWGHNVEAAFYAQHQLEALNLENTVIRELMECGSQKTELELRTLLGCFLFSGDDVEKKIRVLSGGEKARVALAKTIISRANFLLLDEPTNHLDLHSCELLIDALNRYQGTYILVSHDRYFISKTANRIWEIVDQRVREFKGGYEEYVEWKERMQHRAEKPALQLEPRNVSRRASHSPSVSRDQKKELQRQQRLLQQLEEKIGNAASEKQRLESLLASAETYSNKQAYLETETAYKEVSEELVKLNFEYEKVFEKLMELDKG